MPYRKVKPMPNEKPTRNEMVLKMHQEHPELTYRDLAEAFNITPQRIYAIVKRFSVDGLLRVCEREVVEVGVVAPEGAGDAKPNT